MSEVTSSELKIVSTEKQKNRDIALQEKIQNYIKNGSEGDLWLQNAKITSLPNCLKVGGKFRFIQYSNRFSSRKFRGREEFISK